MDSDCLLWWAAAIFITGTESMPSQHLNYWGGELHAQHWSQWSHPLLSSPDLVRGLGTSSPMATYTSPERGEELWRLGLIIEAGTAVPALQASPLSVLLVPQTTSPPLSGQIGAIAVCKSSTLDTYDFVNDYTGKGCQVKSADLRNCRWPHALVVPSNVAGGGVNLEGVKEGLAPADLQVKAGSTHPVSPTLLCASPVFLSTYGFVSRERVWFHPTTAVPLERVVLLAASGGWGLSTKGRGQTCTHVRVYSVP